MYSYADKKLQKAAPSVGNRQVNDTNQMKYTYTENKPEDRSTSVGNRQENYTNPRKNSYSDLYLDKIFMNPRILE